MSQFVCEALGVKSLAGTSLNLPRLLKEETTTSTPVLLVTTPGADPSQELEEFAEKVRKRKLYQFALPYICKRLSEKRIIDK